MFISHRNDLQRFPMGPVSLLLPLGHKFSFALITSGSCILLQRFPILVLRVLGTCRRKRGFRNHHDQKKGCVSIIITVFHSYSTFSHQGHWGEADSICWHHDFWKQAFFWVLLLDGPHNPVRRFDSSSPEPGVTCLPRWREVGPGVIVLKPRLFRARGGWVWSLSL